MSWANLSTIAYNAETGAIAPVTAGSRLWSDDGSEQKETDMEKRLHTLLIRHEGENFWSPEMSDLDMALVTYERGYYHDRGHSARDLLIITTDNDDKAVQVAVDLLNRKLDLLAA